jgi:hypothetical protein
MGTSKRNRASAPNQSRDRKKTAKTDLTDVSQQKLVEPSKVLLETAAAADCVDVVASPSNNVHAPEHEVSSVIKVQVPDFDVEKLVDYYHNYGVDCLVTSTLRF